MLKKVGMYVDLHKLKEIDRREKLQAANEIHPLSEYEKKLLASEKET